MALDFRSSNFRNINELLIYNLRNRNCNTNIVKKNYSFVKLIDVNYKDCYLNSPLHYAVQNCSEKLEILREVLCYGADPNAINANGNSPFHLAVLKGNPQVILELIKHRADIELLNSEGNTPLHIAAMQGKPHIIEILLRNRSFINCRNNKGNTPLHIAAIHGKLAAIKTLVAWEANVNCVNKDGNTALHMAVIYDKPAVIEILIKNYQAFINCCNNKGEKSLHLAVKSGKLSTIKLLVCLGADIDCTDIEGNTPLQFAVVHDKLSVVQTLIEYKSDVNKPNKFGNTPLHQAVINGNVDIAQTLISHKALVNFSNLEGNTPLHLAAIYDRYDIVKLLMASGAKINISNNNKLEPLHIAAIHGKPHIISILIEKQNKGMPAKRMKFFPTRLCRSDTEEFHYTQSANPSSSDSVPFECHIKNTQVSNMPNHSGNDPEFHVTNTEVDMNALDFLLNQFWNFVIASSTKANSSNTFSTSSTKANSTFIPYPTKENSTFIPYPTKANSFNMFSASSTKTNPSNTFSASSTKINPLVHLVDLYSKKILLVHLLHLYSKQILVRFCMLPKKSNSSTSFSASSTKENPSATFSASSTKENWSATFSMSSTKAKYSKFYDVSVTRAPTLSTAFGDSFTSHSQPTANANHESEEHSQTLPPVSCTTSSLTYSGSTIFLDFSELNLPFCPPFTNSSSGEFFPSSSTSPFAPNSSFIPATPVNAAPSNAEHPNVIETIQQHFHDCVHSVLTSHSGSEIDKCMALRNLVRCYVTNCKMEKWPLFLQKAVISGNSDELASVASSGWKVDPSNMDGNSLLHLAAVFGKPKVIKPLIRVCSTINCKNKELNTPLHLAAICGESKVIEVLIQFGADMDLLNRRRISALQIALEYCKTNVIKVFGRTGAKRFLTSAKILIKYDVLKKGLYKTRHRVLKANVVPQVFNYAEECCAEIHRMKSKTLDKSVSFYQFFVKLLSSLNTLSESPLVQHSLNYLIEVFGKKEYPIYYRILVSVIISRLEKSLLKNKLMESADYAKNKGKIFLDPELFHCISNYLSNIELFNLILAFSDTK
ncbi:ankyrin-3 [Caerostris extrusa]|uniref:Ankyrin-3 n=1 Tax=Caerostris extrusa TaxID=172846 RepID=A0AAV4R4W1_CAEEX|nr:ankyrin-3 [Caerostris extrusa]